MSLKNCNDFFNRKKEWSGIKDELLRSYLKPYITKILAHGGPVRYIDCFAGAGKFQDGTIGSPLIALKEVEDAISISYVENKDIKLFFIEKEHAKELMDSVRDNSLVGEVVDGCFEKEIIPLAKKLQLSNLFCYIDPFGVKVLDSNILDEILNLDFNTVEMLINFNSFGFFRWACAHEKVQIDTHTSERYSSFIEDDDTCTDSNDDSLNKIVGSATWKGIISDYNSEKNYNKNAGRVAVEKIADLYWQFLKSKFRYVLKLKISIKSSGKAEYHMFFVTNHRDGAILMGDSMGKREFSMRKIREGGQLALFEDDDVDENKSFVVIDSLLNKFRIESKCVRLKDLEAISYTFMEKCIPESSIRDYLKALEKSGRIKVMRYPDKTKQGKKSTFWTEDKNQSLYIIP